MRGQSRDQPAKWSIEYKINVLICIHTIYTFII